MRGSGPTAAADYPRPADPSARRWCQGTVVGPAWHAASPLPSLSVLNLRSWLNSRPSHVPAASSDRRALDSTSAGGEPSRLVFDVHRSASLEKPPGAALAHE